MGRQALGKGLSALLPEVESESDLKTGAEPRPAAGLHDLPVDDIDPSPFQPRQRFEAGPLEELARSLRAGGVLQPVIVRRMGDRYELVAGERRLRASKMAGLERIPALLRTLSDQEALEVSLLENVQREDLNSIEQARAYQRLSSEFALTQEEIADRTGKDRTTIANLLRLLRLPKEVQEMIEQGKITAGHARALLRLEDSPAVLLVLARRMVARRTSVRQAEEMVERKLPGGKKARSVRRTAGQDPNILAAQRKMEEALGTKVRIVTRRGGTGRVEIDYYNQADLDRIYDNVVGKQSENTH